MHLALCGMKSANATFLEVGVAGTSKGQQCKWAISENWLLQANRQAHDVPFYVCIHRHGDVIAPGREAGRYGDH